MLRYDAKRACFLLRRINPQRRARAPHRPVSCLLSAVKGLAEAVTAQHSTALLASSAGRFGACRLSDLQNRLSSCCATHAKQSHRLSCLPCASAARACEAPVPLRYRQHRHHRQPRLGDPWTHQCRQRGHRQHEVAAAVTSSLCCRDSACSSGAAATWGGSLCRRQCEWGRGSSRRCCCGCLCPVAARLASRLRALMCLSRPCGWLLRPPSVAEPP